MSPQQRRRIKRRSDGGFRLRISSDEHALLASLPIQLNESLQDIKTDNSPTTEPIRRLFPPAYPTDSTAEANFVSAVRGDLVAHHQEALEVLIRTANATDIEDGELEAWLVAVNDLRLVLGTSLGVTEEAAEVDPGGSHYAEYLCYHYLSFLEGEIVEALIGLLPEPDAVDDETLPDDPWGEPLGGLRWDGTSQPDPLE